MADEGEIVSIASGALTAEIAAKGAELHRLVTGAGLDLQWDGDPAVWKGRAPILFPIIGVLQDGRYRLDGRTFAMSRHGFAREQVFELVERTPARAVLRLDANDRTRAVYPFEFRLELAYAMEGARLGIEARVINPGAAQMPASFGFHPALRWPLPFGQPREGHRLQFEQDEPGELRRIDGEGLLRPEALASPIEGDTLVLRDDLFTDDALIFDQVRSRRVLYGAPSGPQIAVAFPDFSRLGVWTKPGAGYICIEPWAGVTDPEGFAGDFTEKPGVFMVPPGGERRLAISLELVAGA